MKKLHTYKWNDYDHKYDMLILTEHDIENNVNFLGAGFEIIVLPSKYKDIKMEYYDTLIKITILRGGEIIYI